MAGTPDPSATTVSTEAGFGAGSGVTSAGTAGAGLAGGGELSPVEELAVLQASVAAVLAVMSLGRLSDLDAVAVLTAVEGLGRSIDAARVTAAAEVGGRAVRIAPGHSQPALPAALGCRDGLEVIVRATRVSVREAKRRSRLGEFVSVRNGVMLCWHHHHHINTSGWKIRTVHGSPQIKAPPRQDPHQNWHPASQNRARTTTATRH